MEGDLAQLKSNLDGNPDLAAGKNRISVDSKLPIPFPDLDGHFVAGNRIWEGASKIEFRWSKTPI